MLNSCGNGIKVLSLTIYKKGKCFPQIKKSKIMKKAMMFVAIALMGLTSCKKEILQPISVENTSGCNCGTVIELYETNETSNNTDKSDVAYSIVKVSNNCSLKEEYFSFDSIKNIGDKVCLDKKW